MINHEFDIIRVLIASQDDEMIKKLILCLTENAYETVTVNNKTDARKNLLSFQPHILLVDRQIPTMNSLDLCREFHNACNIPILMLSNDDNIVDKVLSLEIGCDDFMTKDFDSRELIARIRAIVRRSHSNMPDFSTLSGTSPSADSDSSAKCITFPGLVINLIGQDADAGGFPVLTGIHRSIDHQGEVPLDPVPEVQDDGFVVVLVPDGQPLVAVPGAGLGVLRTLNQDADLLLLPDFQFFNVV